MPKLRKKKSIAQLQTFSVTRENREYGLPTRFRNVGELSTSAASDLQYEGHSPCPDLSNDDAGEVAFSPEFGFPDYSDENDSFVCAYDEEEVASFFIGEYDNDHYYDSGNEDEEDNAHFIPHGLVFGRKHNMLFEEVDGRIDFVPYNGDETDVFQILITPYKGAERKATIGFSHFKVIQKCGLNKPMMLQDLA